MSIGSILSVPTTATRHLLDANVTFGTSSDRFNARDKYRNGYSDEQRLGAGVGAGLAVALPAAAGVAWMQRGLSVPGLTNRSQVIADNLQRAAVQGLSPAVMGNIGRVAGIAALGVATAVGVKKSVEIAKDDGHLGAVGTTAGVIAGAVAGGMVGSKFGGVIGGVSAGVGALALGAAGHFGGKAIDIGESQIGKEHVQAPNVDENLADRAKSFGHGAFTHFNEVGPATQGVSLGNSWGMRETVQTKYSNAERAGGMHGDLLAAGIMGSGAIGVAAVMGRQSQAAKAAAAAGQAFTGQSAIRAGGDAAGAIMARGGLTGIVHKVGTLGTAGAGAAAVGIAGLTAWRAYEHDSEQWGTGSAAAIGVGTLAATAGTALAVSKLAKFTEGTSGAARVASSVLVAASLIGVVTAVRLPMQQFMNDAKDAHAASNDIDPAVKWGSTAIGGVAAGGGALLGLSRMVPDGFNFKVGPISINKTAVVAAGTAVSLAAGAGVGLGLSATMPDLPQVGASVAGGVALGGVAALAMRGVPNLPGVGGTIGRVATGVVAGAALGLTASSLLKQDAPAAPAEVTPQEAAGTVGG